MCVRVHTGFIEVSDEVEDHYGCEEHRNALAVRFPRLQHFLERQTENGLLLLRTENMRSQMGGERERAEEEKENDELLLLKEARQDLLLFLLLGGLFCRERSQQFCTCPGTSTCHCCCTCTCTRTGPVSVLVHAIPAAPYLL